MANPEYEYYEEYEEYYYEDEMPAQLIDKVIQDIPVVSDINDTELPATSSNVDNDDKKELGTSDDYINKQLVKVMDGLNIPQTARPAMFNLAKAQKLTMIQQYNRKQNGSSNSPKLTNVKRQNQPKSNGPNLDTKLIPILGKSISTPKLVDASNHPSTQNTISLADAQQKLKQRPHTKSRSNIDIPSLPQIKPKNDNNINNKRSSLPIPPPVPHAIKQRYQGRSSGDNNSSNRTSIRSVDSDQNTMEDIYNKVAYDDDYEYYEEEIPSEQPQKPQKPPQAPPPQIQPLKPQKAASSASIGSNGNNNGKSTKSVKVKLRIGSEVEVYSNSKNRWIDGNIIKIKGKLICVAYGPDASTQKWLEATSKNFRPKMAGISSQKSQRKVPSLNLATTSNASPHEAKDCYDVDAYNNPTAKRFRESVALQQKKQVKVKLRIGSPVEVFSVSKNKWVDGKLTGIKKNLIRVAYGANFTTEKWLRSTSKQFRPKLDMVDDAVLKSPDPDKPNPMNLGTVSYAALSGGDNQYEIANNNDDGTYIPPQQQQMYQLNGMQYAAAAGVGSGAYITHSLRREQYQAYSDAVVRGTNTQRGDLKIKVHGALQLRSNGHYASITVAEHCLKTKKVSSDENPVWKEILTFSNFRPALGKTGIISVIHKSALLGEKIIGSAEFELPIVFGRQEKMTIDIADNKNKLSGIVVLEQVVVESGR